MLLLAAMFMPMIIGLAPQANGRAKACRKEHGAVDKVVGPVWAILRPVALPAILRD